MYCINCGKKLTEGELCECTVKTSKKEGRGGEKKKFTIFACCVLLFAIGIIFLATRREKIHLENYLIEELNVHGTDGYAKFELYEIFDSNAFMKEVCGDYIDNQVDVDEYTSEEELEDVLETIGVQLEAYEEIEGSITLSIYVNGKLTSEPSNLKNGDKVTINVSSDIGKSKAFDKKFVNGSKTYKINGLEKATVISPFDEKYFSLTFSGVEGEGKIDWEVSEELALTDYLTYEISGEKYANFSNGDKVTLQVVYDETYMTQNGYALSETSKEFTVEGLGVYIASLKEFPDQLLSQIKNASGNKIANNSDADEYSNAVYQKIYFMNMKENADTSGFLLKQPQNRLIIVYSAKENFWGYDAYVCVEYSNITTDGTTVLFNGCEKEADAALVNLYYASAFESSFEDYELIYKIETFE